MSLFNLSFFPTKIFINFFFLLTQVEFIHWYTEKKLFFLASHPLTILHEQKFSSHMPRSALPLFFFFLSTENHSGHEPGHWSHSAWVSRPAAHLPGVTLCTSHVSSLGISSIICKTGLRIVATSHSQCVWHTGRSKCQLLKEERLDSLQVRALSTNNWQYRDFPRGMQVRRVSSKQIYRSLASTYMLS